MSLPRTEEEFREWFYSKCRDRTTSCLLRFDHILPLVERVKELESLVSKLRNLSDTPDVQEKVLRDFGYYDLAAERDRLKEDKQDLQCEIAQCRGELDYRAKDIQRLAAELAEARKKE